MECFKINSNEVEGRLDCFYYKPEFVELEKRIKRLTSKTLRDYIVNIAGGATPDKDESEKYYSDETNGIPFLRVQNLSEEGLNFDNIKFINTETHNGMLKRSQVKEGYLLTKITGVGRMAVSSVAPKGFEGNINQHIVAIKTESYKTSEVLANFLNSDIGERLAFRRSTGGTRPALDYEALKTIPIVFEPKIVSIMQSAFEQKKQKEQEADKLLNSMYGFVLDELGIKLPELKDKKCYSVDSGDIKSRLDPYYHKPSFLNRYKAIKASKYTVYDFRELLLEVKNGVEIRTYSEKGNRYMRVTDLGETGIVDHNPRYVFAKEIPERIKLTTKDFLISRSGSLGLVSVVTENMLNYILSSHIFKITLDFAKLNPFYLQAFLRSNIGQFQFFHNNNGGIIPEINQEALKSIKIVVPPLDIQQKIANEVERRMDEAGKLKSEANNLIDKAKREVETLIL
ncbi:MAG: restriction endonuclease subunit S [Candidatus Omnitrophica bacterium]|nr:restriction endonuclease subunit S [Candidatus Omnitrophota bacterium]